MSRVVEITISGIDGGGFAWQNVFHMQTTDDAATVPVLLAACNTEVNTNIVPVLAAAMSSVYKILDVASKVIDPTPSYTIHKPISTGGGRASTAAIGAVCGSISFFPAAGNHVGRIFVVGCLQGDWALDVIGGTYSGLLDNVGTAFVGEAGGAPTYAWQFGIWNKSTPAFLPVVSSQTKQRPTTLNKRIRA